MSIDLKPCPFCGGSDFEIVENGRIWSGMKYSEPVSVSVRHWCPATPGQPSRMIERVGRDEDGAIAAWNTRAHAEQAGVTDDVGRDAERYRWILCNYLKFHLPDEAWKHGSLDAAIDAAMLAAAPAQKGQP